MRPVKGYKNKLDNKIVNWLLFIVLAFIWGSSFILMKEGLRSLSAAQVASLRIISSGLVLLPVAYKSFKKIPRNKMLVAFLSGVLGSLLPAYLFCMAEQNIDSSLAGVLNALTPIFVIIMGALFFNNPATAAKITGIIIAFAGSILLFFSQPGFSQNSNLMSVLLVVLATLFYGINVNMVQKYLTGIPSVNIAAAALVLNAVPALAVLYFTGYFTLSFRDEGIITSSLLSCLLGIGGTAIATILFYMLLKRAGAVFASMVTYAIPIVAFMWGVVYHETIGWKQAVSMLVILCGVYWANRKK